MEPVELFDFMQAGIEQRELAKFQFTRNLSDALVLISDYGSELGFSKDDLAYCDISIFKELHISAIDPYETLAKNIDLGRSRYAQTLATALPPIISDPNDAWAFEWPESSPNFVTQLDVIAPVAGSNDPLKVAHAIICIPNADPGFDWLFTHPIAGLITAWGGVNSHMAIRASELGIPAVIGAGEQLYNIWSSAKRLRIDCAGQRVEIIE